jgi:hypothetical protein
MILQPSPPANSNPMIQVFLLMLVLAIAGAITDRQYRRKGGKKSTRRDKVYFTVTVALVAAMFGAAISIRAVVVGESPFEIGYDMGSGIGPPAILLFAAWELGRWRVRRKNPLPTKL